MGELWPPLAQGSTLCSLERSHITVLSISPEHNIEPVPEEEEGEEAEQVKCIYVSL